MPELPEVETIKNELSQSITGRSFIGITINDARLVQNPLEEFSRGLIGQSILQIARRGKYLILHLSSGRVLLMHLRMTGGVLLNPPLQDKFARVIFELDDHSIMVFRDIRRFGTIELADDTTRVESKLGMEPLDEAFTPAYLEAVIKKRQVPIKSLLLEQNVIAGLGNMYADEALFAARIHPLKAASALSRLEIQHLHSAITDVLSEAIACGGASVANYQKIDGSPGSAHCNFEVAHRLDQTCYTCHSRIRRIVVRQRGTYFCPHCQRK
jgi:formamidopyrimidine-DNA glycosylase